MNVQNPIIIVPLIDEAAAPQLSSTPQLTYRDGPLLADVQVVPITWGSAWTRAALQALPARIDAFFDAVFTSDLMDVLREYSVPGYQLGSGTRATSVGVATDPPSNVTDDTLQQQIAGWIKDGTLPAATTSTLYCLFLPPGVTVAQGGGKSCTVFCGYHNATPAGLYYAVIPYPDCQGCIGGLAAFDALTSVTSHELCEAITDPAPGQGWYDDQNGEIGDICAWKTRTIGEFTVQLEWSNSQGACV